MGTPASEQYRDIFIGDGEMAQMMHAHICSLRKSELTHDDLADTHPSSTRAELVVTRRGSLFYQACIIDEHPSRLTL
jgi:hypothetical protein